CRQRFQVDVRHAAQAWKTRPSDFLATLPTPPRPRFHQTRSYPVSPMPCEQTGLRLARSTDQPERRPALTNALQHALFLANVLEKPTRRILARCAPDNFQTRHHATQPRLSCAGCGSYAKYA